MRPLPLDKQLKVIQDAKRNFINSNEEIVEVKLGLCILIFNSLDDNDLINIKHIYQSQLIPLFSHENSIPFGGGNFGEFWFSRKERDGGYNYLGRLAFLNWIESELKRQIAEQ